MEKHITIIFEDETLEKVRKYAKKKTGSSKALSGTINQIINKYLSREVEEDPPIHSNNTHTHKSGIDDILDYIKENNPKGITKNEIDKAIKDMKGFDMRTINKYEPIVLDTLKEKGYREHPNNPKVLIRYDID